MCPVDERWMKLALAQARKGEGLTRPNPPVGAALVKNGRLIADGFHHRAGGPHAEIVALRKAGAAAKGATLYVTLEPCSTWGRTPPCTSAIIEAGVRRVVVSVLDPNPKHAGRGLDLLCASGIQIAQDVCADEGTEILAPFARWITAGLPFVTLKLGMSLDGRIAESNGHSRWITGPESRKIVHALRRRADAILVGFGTARADNPTLLPVPSRGRRPFRVALDRSGKLSLQNRIFCDGMQRQTIVATSLQSSARYRAALNKLGVETLILPVTRDGLSLKKLFAELGKRGLMHVLCEGGGQLAGALLRQHLVNQAYFILAPRLLGETGIASVGGIQESLRDPTSLRITSCSQLGEDVLIKAIRR